MKYFSFFSIVIILLFSFSKCKSDNTLTTTEKFIEYIKSEDYDNAKSLFCQRWKDNNAINLDFKLKKSHELLEKYGIPGKDKWKVSYDTSSILKIKKYTILIDGDYDSKKPVYMELYFERNIVDSIYIFILNW